MFFGRVVNEAPARPLQCAPLVPNRLRQPFHVCGYLMRAFDEGISGDLRELTTQT
jgi:hypothetical protein